MPQPSREPVPWAGRAGEPSMLDLVRLGHHTVLPPGGETLYREIGALAQLRAGTELLLSAAGRGVSARFLAQVFGCDVTGVEPDAALVEQAERQARAAGLAGRVGFHAAALEDLPYRDAIFDVVLGEIGLAAAPDPAAAVRELARVTKPLGCVVLVQLIWTGHVDAERREMLARHLGARPLILVEWKQMLRDAGVVDLRVEDWSDSASAFRAGANGPTAGFASRRSLLERIGVLRRARRRWGWRGLRAALAREREVQRLLTSERILGLSLVIGTKWPGPDAAAPASP